MQTWTPRSCSLASELNGHPDGNSLPECNGASYVVELKSVEECNINAPHSHLRSNANEDLVKD
jgi:hypothetical protein